MIPIFNLSFLFCGIGVGRTANLKMISGYFSHGSVLYSNTSRLSHFSLSFCVLFPFMFVFLLGLYSFFIAIGSTVVDVVLVQRCLSLCMFRIWNGLCVSQYVCVISHCVCPIVCLRWFKVLFTFDRKEMEADGLKLFGFFVVFFGEGWGGGSRCFLRVSVLMFVLDTSVHIASFAHISVYLWKSMSGLSAKCIQLETVCQF